MPTEQLGYVSQVVEWVPLVCYMQGLSGYNRENLTSNHSGALCWERCHVSHMLKNPAVVFDRSGNLCAPPQEAKLPDPMSHPFLAHLAKGQVSLCYHLASVMDKF